jgi:hypothetical protein
LIIVKTNILIVSIKSALFIVNHVIAKYKDDDDVIKSLHLLCLSSLGTKGQRKKNLKTFNGFDESRTPQSTIESKLTGNKKWTTELLKAACDIFGLEKSGTRAGLIERLAEYLMSPRITKSVSEAPSALKVQCNPSFIISRA